MAKKGLLVISGMDRVGKDTYITYRENLDEDGIYHFHEEVKDRPDYRDNKKWIEFLTNWARNQKDDLVAIRDKPEIKGMFMCRLGLDDDVYCTLFKRDFIQRQFNKEIEEHYDVHYVAFLWKDYESYINRLKLIGDDIENPEYSREEFYRVKELYKQFAPLYDTKILELSGDEKVEDIHAQIEAFYKF